MSRKSSFVAPEQRPIRRMQSRPPNQLLTFSQFKARSVSANENDKTPVYNPTLEQFPDDEWYTLEHDKINSGIRDMCAPLLETIQSHSHNDAEVSNLTSTLQTASVIPQGRRFYVAFLGEQGTGKSSLSNSVFNRDLVPVSSSSSACTAYATIITHKPGADDDSRTCDVRTEYLIDAEIRECSEEQVRRYRDAYPRKTRPDTQTGISDEPDFSFEVGIDNEKSDDEDDQIPTPSSTSTRFISPAVLRGGRTARSFLETIFGTEGSEMRQSALYEELDYADIQRPGFIDMCVEQARERVRQARGPDEFSATDMLDDEQLGDYHEVTAKIWPLVKSVHIATGHVLLRNNMCIMDLPGYGDDNHIRTALVDRFRQMAHFEIVVAPTSRMVSSVVQQRYLSRSIRRLGAHNTLLVTNQSDAVLDRMQKEIEKLAEEPFPLLRKHLSSLIGINEDRKLVWDYRQYLIKEARDAYIQREARIIKTSLEDTAIDILPTSARQYSLCLDDGYGGYEYEAPKLTPEATGVPKLRRYLFHLPAQTNYRTLYYHVFETLPDVVTQIQRILEKFDDNGYSEMRAYLAEQLPLVCKTVQALAQSLPTHHTAEPFDGPEDKSRVNSELKSVVQGLEAPHLYYQTFAKMLKENGIPVNGSGLGKNLNEMILNGMIAFINVWYEKMQDETESIAVKLDKPIEAILGALKKHCKSYDGNPELKERATELFDTASRRIGMAYGKLAAQLQSKLREIHLLYTTETNTQCPIALEMKGIYQDVLQQQLTHPGPGSYGRQRARLLDSLIYSDWPRRALPDTVSQKIHAAQLCSWKQCCEEYVTEATTLLRHFARAIDELHNNGALLPSDHRRVRTQLEALLPKFKSQLARVQAEFPVPQAERSSTSSASAGTGTAKRKIGDERVDTQPPCDKSPWAKRTKTLSQSSQFRAMSAQPMTSLREKLFVWAEQTREPVVKREASP